VNAPLPRYAGLFGRDLGTPESFWISLRYFNLYRIVVATLFLGASAIYSTTFNLGSYRLELFRGVCVAYLALGIGFHWMLRTWRDRFNLQLSAHAIADIAAITLLMFASGGIRSGLGIMLLISLIGAALVAPQRLALLYAALAAIAVLLEQTFWVLAPDWYESGYLQPALFAIGCFACAGVTNWLAQRVSASERLARQRGQELENQMRVNRLVIAEMQDGVLVLDRDGRVTQHNPQAQLLLDAEALIGMECARIAPELDAAWRAWREQGVWNAPADIYVRGRDLRVRLAEPGRAEEFTVLFVEDMSRSREQARQLKLAALGRLTANIAHEIRNPLSAISHAVDLLEDERGQDDRERLGRIIRDNTRRLDRLVSDVMQLNRRDRISAERIDLRAWLPAFVEDFAANESVPSQRFALDAGREVAIEFDKEHLRQVLWNLLRNAVRHASADASSVRIELRSLARQVELNVIDNGQGVAPEHQAQLFEPFFTTDSKGTGLGLYLARELCAANRARLEYVNDVQGAHFRLLCREARA
jgi:two-component system, NtrC family, sensor histidine kinase PilS